MFKSFSELSKSMNNGLLESPVGLPGRTGQKDAVDFIEKTNIQKQFMKLVKEMGGITVAKQLLIKMDNDRIANKVVPEVPEIDPLIDNYKNYMAEGKETIESYLRDAGYKIKEEIPSKDGMELEFYKKDAATNAFEDLKSAGFGKDFNLDLAGTIITYKLIK